MKETKNKTKKIDYKQIKENYTDYYRVKNSFDENILRNNIKKEIEEDEIRKQTIVIADIFKDSLKNVRKELTDEEVEKELFSEGMKYIYNYLNIIISIHLREHGYIDLEKINNYPMIVNCEKSKEIINQILNKKHIKEVEKYFRTINEIEEMVEKPMVRKKSAHSIFYH